MLESRSGITFTEDEYTDAWNYVPHPGHRIPLPIPELLGLLADLDTTPAVHTTDDFPIVLAAGQRRAFTANTIFRDNTWRKRDPQGALRVSPHDAEQLGLSDGALAQVTTSRGTAQAVVEIDDRLQPGHAALPNGFGLDLPTEDGGTERTGVALNSLTDLNWRDPIAGTPWHKHVPARIQPAPA
ncbi:molybdopterin dinucleotide binding domain-containing protein [Streptomyces violaceus]